MVSATSIMHRTLKVQVHPPRLICVDSVLLINFVSDRYGLALHADPVVLFLLFSSVMVLSLSAVSWISTGFGANTMRLLIIVSGLLFVGCQTPEGCAF